MPRFPLPFGSRELFLSLKWKLLLPLTLIIFLMAAALTYVNNRSLAQQQTQLRASAAQQARTLVHFLLSQSYQQLADKAAGLADTLPDDFPRHLPADTLEQNWQKWHLEEGLKSLQLFNPAAYPVAGFGSAPLPGAQIDRLTRAALSTETPQEGLYCGTICVLYWVGPFLKNHNTAGAIFLTRDLGDFLATFHRYSGLNLALATGTPRSETFSLRQVTSAQLAQALQRSSPHWTPTKGGAYEASLDLAGRHLQLQMLPPLSASSDFPRLFTVTDDTAYHDLVRSSRHKNLLIGFLTFVVAEGMMLAFLLWFLTRIRRVTESLPLLGDGNWQAAQDRLAHPAQGVADEFDRLESAAMALARRLQTMHEADARQRDSLRRSAENLARERDFISNLLDTVPALILTQDTHGRIQLINAHTSQVTGLSYTELAGRNFFRHLIPPEQEEALRAALQAHLAADDWPLRFEARLETSAGMRHIAWILTQAGANPDGEAMILCVGLDLTELHAANERAEFLSDFDALTGLLNHRAFQARLKDLLAAVPEGILLLFDLDEFKTLNDLAGHATGDAVLRQIAARLENLEPRPRLSARLGSDDFALFFAETPIAQVLQIARAVAKGQGHHQVSSACVGLARFPEHGKSPEALLASADLALSHARALGRGNWHLYDPGDRTRQALEDKNQRVSLIRQALDQGRLELYLQPIVALADGEEAAHYEVLLRLRGHDAALLAPAEFIQAAEASGLVREIDEWVARSAIALLGLRGGDFRLAVNLSARSLDNEHLVEVIRNALHTHQVAPHRLIFEVTETAALADISRAQKLLQNIRDLGVGLALDDFGVGFSTFQYLKHLPVDYVKIDGSFIRNLDENQDDRVFVRAVVEAVHGYGKKVVAEYVENAMILERVRELGLDYAQGYHLGRPRPAAEVV